MTTTKPQPIGRARTTALVLAEEIAQAEHDLIAANAAVKSANKVAELAQGKAGAAWSRQQNLRRRLNTRIRMLREVIKSDGIEERAAALWIVEERDKLKLPEVNRGLKPYSIAQALPYEAMLAKDLRDEDETHHEVAG